MFSDSLAECGGWIGEDETMGRETCKEPAAVCVQAGTVGQRAWAMHKLGWMSSGEGQAKGVVTVAWLSVWQLSP